MDRLVISEDDIDRFFEAATEAAAMCNKGRACPSPIYCGCPFKHVLKMPDDCRRTRVSHWVVLLKRLAEMEGTI